MPSRSEGLDRDFLAGRPTAIPYTVALVRLREYLIIQLDRVADQQPSHSPDRQKALQQRATEPAPSSADAETKETNRRKALEKRTAGGGVNT